MSLGNHFESSFEILKTGTINEAIDKFLNICDSKLGIPRIELKWVSEWLSKGRDDFIKKRFVDWLFVTASLFSSSERLLTVFKTKQSIIKEIAKLSPVIRETLVKDFFFLLHKKNEAAFYRRLESTKGITHLKLPSMIFANFPQEGEDVFISALKTLKAERDIYKNSKHQTLLLETLIKLSHSGLEESKKKDLIHGIFQASSRDRIKMLQWVKDILAFKGEEFFNVSPNLTALENAMKSLFIKKFGVEIDQFNMRYEKSIGLWRKKEALFTYAGKLNELSSQKLLALELFQKLLKMILTDTFKTGRYNLAENPHLAEIARSHETVYARWQQEERLDSSEIQFAEPVKAIPVAERIVTNLKLALENHHLGGNEQGTLYPYVDRGLNTSHDIKKIIELIQKEHNTISNVMINPETLVRKQALLLQKKLLELFSNPVEIKKQLTDLKSLVPAKYDFNQDIEDSIQMLSNKGKKKPPNYQVFDSDDPNHFLLMGTEVLNSCQQVNGSSELNVCLLGYFLDGKHRLNLICDSENHILARSVIRLMMDAQGQPVLFLERFYVADAAPEYPVLLTKMAIKKAKSLGIPLVCSQKHFEKAGYKSYPHSIIANGKPVPFEYVDAVEGKQAGIYAISQVLQII